LGCCCRAGFRFQTRALHAQEVQLLYFCPTCRSNAKFASFSACTTKTKRKTKCCGRVNYQSTMVIMHRRKGPNVSVNAMHVGGQRQCNHTLATPKPPKCQMKKLMCCAAQRRTAPRVECHDRSDCSGLLIVFELFLPPSACFVCMDEDRKGKGPNAFLKSDDTGAESSQPLPSDDRGRNGSVARVGTFDVTPF